MPFGRGADQGSISIRQPVGEIVIQAALVADAGGGLEGDYKDQSDSAIPSAWQEAAHKEMLQTAIGIGKVNRGIDGLNILQKNLQSGVQPDLIEQSKRRSIKVW